MSKLRYVIVTARDEDGRIGATLSALAGTFPNAELLVGDDRSRDDTASVAQAAGARVICNRGRAGKGEAATVAVDALPANIKDDGDTVILFCDADLGPTASRLKPLVDVVEGGDADLAVAAFSRRYGGGFGIALGFARRVVRRLTGLELEAPISGQRAVSGKALGAAVPFASGFGMELGMTVDAVRSGFRLEEVELDLEHRATGRGPIGFYHRARQLKDLIRAYMSRRRKAR